MTAGTDGIIPAFKQLGGGTRKKDSSLPFKEISQISRIKPPFTSLCQLYDHTWLQGRLGNAFQQGQGVEVEIGVRKLRSRRTSYWEVKETNTLFPLPILLVTKYVGFSPHTDQLSVRKLRSILTLFSGDNVRSHRLRLRPTRLPPLQMPIPSPDGCYLCF